MLGPLAALGTALCWVFTSLSFASAGRRVGSTAVNLLRLFVALAILGLVHRIVFGVWTPTMDRAGFIYLALSGLIGLTIGDQFLFTAFVDIGPRLSTLLMTFWSPIAAVLAWFMLEESMRPTAMLGIAVTLAGVAWVILERPKQHVKQQRSRHHVRGIFFGLGGAAGQAIGFVLAKLGMGHTRLPRAEHLNPWSATLTRMAVAAAGMVLLYATWRVIRSPKQIDEVIEISPELENLERAGHSKRSIWPFALLMIFTGSVCGPVLGVWLSLVALDNAPAGVAATLMTMTPVFILPFAMWWEKEHVSWRAAIGAAVAVAGVAILSFASRG